MTKREAAALLGLKPDATAEQIKKAYRRLAMRLHPDKVGGSRIRFQEIMLARDVLSGKRPESSPALDPKITTPFWK